MSRPVVSEESSLASKCMEFCQALASQEKAFSFSLKIGDTFSFSLDTKEKAPAPQARKVSPSTQKRNYLRRQKFLASKAKPQNEALEEPADISVSLDANDSQDVTLSQNEDLSASTFRCDQCDYYTRTSRGLKMHVSKQHKISQLDGEDEVLEDSISDKPEEPTILGMQENGFSKLEMIDSDETPPSKVIHPRLGLGTSPRRHEDKTHIEYSFATGKFGIKIVPTKEK